MTDTEEPSASELVGGKMFLYENPQLLTKQDHESLGFTPPKSPFEHVRSALAIPLTMTEFGSAQRNYPIIFSSLENPLPLAIVGLVGGANLFIAENGEWDPMCYLPSYLRCYPFAFAAEKEGRLAVIVDRAAAAVTENSEFPFFVDGEISEQTRALMQFCAQYEAERKRTMEFCDKLVELELLTPHRATHKPDESSEATPLAEYVSVEAQKLNDLDSDVIFDLHKTGQLSAMYLQLYSLENWRHLMARRVEKASRAA